MKLTRGSGPNPRAKVLLKTDHPKNNPELAWVTEYGKSRVFDPMLGHDRKAYDNPGYRKVLHQAIRWAAVRLRPPGELFLRNCHLSVVFRHVRRKV